MISIEEINGSKPSVMLILNSLLDDLSQVAHPITGQAIKAEAGFVMCGTFNKGYAGTRRMNKALINRFDLAITVNQMSEAQHSKVLKERMQATENEINIA